MINKYVWDFMVGFSDREVIPFLILVDISMLTLQLTYPVWCLTVMARRQIITLVPSHVLREDYCLKHVSKIKKQGIELAASYLRHLSSPHTTKLNKFNLMFLVMFFLCFLFLFCYFTTDWVAILSWRSRIK